MSVNASHVEVVRGIIADVLAVEGDEVVPEARFFADLGGESIDLLDLSFQIEKQLGCRVDFSRFLTGEQLQVDARGVVSKDSLRALHEMYPFLAIDRLKPNPTAEDMKDLLTVETISRFVELASAQGTQSRSNV